MGVKKRSNLKRLVIARAKARARARARARDRDRARTPTRVSTRPPRPRPVVSGSDFNVLNVLSTPRPRPTRVTVASPSGREGRTITVSSRSILARGRKKTRRKDRGQPSRIKGQIKTFDTMERSGSIAEPTTILDLISSDPARRKRDARRTVGKGKAQGFDRDSAFRKKIIRDAEVRARPPSDPRSNRPIPPLPRPPTTGRPTRPIGIERPTFASFIPFQQQPEPKQTRGQTRSRGTPAGRKTTRRLLTSVRQRAIKPVQFPLEELGQLGSRGLRAVRTKFKRDEFGSDFDVLNFFG